MILNSLRIGVKPSSKCGFARLESGDAHVKIEAVTLRISLEMLESPQVWRSSIDREVARVDTTLHERGKPQEFPSDGESMFELGGDLPCPVYVRYRPCHALHALDWLLTGCLAAHQTNEVAPEKPAVVISQHSKTLQSEQPPRVFEDYVIRSAYSTIIFQFCELMCGIWRIEIFKHWSIYLVSCQC